MILNKLCWWNMAFNYKGKWIFIKFSLGGQNNNEQKKVMSFFKMDLFLGGGQCRYLLWLGRSQKVLEICYSCILYMLTFVTFWCLVRHWNFCCSFWCCCCCCCHQQHNKTNNNIVNLVIVCMQKAVLFSLWHGCFCVNIICCCRWMYMCASVIVLNIKVVNLNSTPSQVFIYSFLFPFVFIYFCFFLWMRKNVDTRILSVLFTLVYGCTYIYVCV